jgi:hypothetical protein
MGKLSGLFFWRKQKSEAVKAEEMIQLYIKYIPQLKQAMERQKDQVVGTDGEIIGRMYDYYKNWEEDFNNNDRWNGDETGIEKKDERIVATPLSVMKELETVPTPFSVEGLDEKIATLKDKTKLLNQRYAKDQIVGLIKRLQNRKKYKDHMDFYLQFPNTTDDAIDKLIEKYKLEINTSDLFVPTFPKEAIDIMKKYSEVTKKVTDETPVYYVIAEHKDFVKKREKLDPILLVQSPFGFYWQILGAWDKEMLLLSEL